MTENVDRLALAHALRTPLTSALLGIGMLHEGSLGKLDRRQRAVLETVFRDLSKLRAIVDAGLETRLLGRHAGPMERAGLDLADLVREATAPLKAQAEGSGLSLSVQANAVDVCADEIRMAWVIASIVGNALRYARKRVEVEIGPDDGEAMLVVHDDGPGVPRRTAARLLTREGGGLGLVLVREVVEAHGGTIALESSRGRGTTVRVRLPMMGAHRAMRTTPP
ncbi:MAG: sensor histidine kinase [Polyangiales bacterium]